MTRKNISVRILIGAPADYMLKVFRTCSGMKEEFLKNTAIKGSNTTAGETRDLPTSDCPYHLHPPAYPLHSPVVQTTMTWITPFTTTLPIQSTRINQHRIRMPKISSTILLSANAIVVYFPTLSFYKYSGPEPARPKQTEAALKVIRARILARDATGPGPVRQHAPPRPLP